MPSIPSYDQPLPLCEGPKLHPFDKGKADIIFKCLLQNGQDSPDSSGEEGHAHVFEVSIDSKTYALKVFKFCGDAEDLVYLDEEEHRQVGSEILHAHMDPFYKEYQFEWQNRSSLFRPFIAILKEFIPDGGPLTEEVIKRILTDLKKMRKQGVYPRDIAARNYKAGLLIDFDCALTEPHFLFGIRPKYMVNHYKEECLFKFDQMIEDEGIKTWVRALPSDDYLDKLRPRSDKGKVYKQTRPYRRKRIHRGP